MMGTSQSLPELVAAAKANARASEDRISEILKLVNGRDASGAQLNEFRVATVALELAAVDIFSLFEVRLQHHFRRGPFSRKLESQLIESGEIELANRIHQYYLAINVLKHGKGASYRELLNAPSSFFSVNSSEDIIADEASATTGLIDITIPGFFDGLTSSILEAYNFLENRAVS